MQAGLKCDRVPQIASFSNAFEPHLNIRLAEKSHSLQQDIEAISMQQNEHFDSSRLTRLLLRKSRQGALATLMAGRGDPYCSLVNVASHPDGTPILLISRLAVHTKNILADARVSLMLDERTDSDPLEGARIMLMGRAEEVASDHLEIVRRR